jgi:hypothetical protein
MARFLITSHVLLCYCLAHTTPSLYSSLFFPTSTAKVQNSKQTSCGGGIGEKKSRVISPSESGTVIQALERRKAGLSRHRSQVLSSIPAAGRSPSRYELQSPPSASKLYHLWLSGKGISAAQMVHICLCNWRRVLGLVNFSSIKLVLPISWRNR